ncbi:MAG: metal-dependent hydrolase [Proteobacteria bacterium]|nr:metal-dependent hydrolase [Pseudomonadota bacterium]
MAEITVRSIRFPFAGSVNLDRPGPELDEILPSLALSMTMPYLEPYLIRTMKVALKEIGDPVLAEDVRRFSQQEGHHFRNHALLNDEIREQFAASIAERLRGIEEALEADYQRFSRSKSLRFNVTYAEGFEAMTCAGALAAAEYGAFDRPDMLPGGDIWAWHMAEEIEHRTVAFQVYEHLVGSYPYRITVGTWSQLHYLRYTSRFARCMAEGLGHKLRRPRSPMHRSALRRYLRTWSPRYDPAKIEIPPGVDALLARFSKLAEAS